MRRVPAPALDGSESGLALIVLLLVALFVGLVGVAMMGDTISEVQIAVNQSNAVQARYLAEAGIADAANRLTQNNTWTGPITQNLAAGSYTVQVDSATSQAGATGAVKSVVSTGSVNSGTAAAGIQTVRETFLVLPQAFTKALLSDTTIIAGDTNSTANTTITNTALRQLGTIHANNVRAASPAVTIQNNSGTNVVSVTGQITASQQSISLGAGTICTACATATDQAVIPFPSFNFATYCNRASGAGTLFTSQTAFNTYVTSKTSGGVATLGSPSAPVMLFVTNGFNFQPQGSTPITIYGTLIVYSQGNGTTCTFNAGTAPSGDMQFNMTAGTPFTITAENGEPALMVGGSVWVNRSNCNPRPAPAITITGIIYNMANTSNPTVTAPSGSGLCVYGSNSGGGPMHVTGTIISNFSDHVDIDSLTYDPSIFFGGLPSALNPPGPPFVLLPISWSSNK